MGIIKHTYQFLFIICFYLVSSNYVVAQNNDSLKFNNHVVVKGETSYGIAKKYNIDLNLFFEANPSATNGLKRGQILRIPLTSFIDSNEPANIDTNLKKHIVIKGETLWSIAKKYGVKVEVIKNYNNIEISELELNQSLFIPNQIADTNNIVSPMVKNPSHPLLSSCDTLIIHRVKKKETLYGIASKYNIAIDKIIKSNPVLSERGLQKDQTLKIICKLLDCNEDSIFNKNEISSEINSSLNYNDGLNISVVLPFLLDFSDTIFKNCEDPSICVLNKKTINSLNLLNGIHLALYELKKSGYKINLNIYDSEYDTNKIKSIISDSVFQSSHLIIGPIYSKNIKFIRTFARTKNIPLITSFDIPNQALFKYPSFYKFHPSKATQIKTLAYYLKENNSKYNVVLLSNKEDNRSLSYANVFSNAYNDTLFLNDSTVINDSIESIDIKRGDNFHYIQRKLSKRDTNLIVIAAYDIPFMTYVFNKIIELSNSENFYKSDFAIAGFDGLFHMNTIDDLYKNKFRLQFVSKGMIDYSTDKVEIFTKRYNKLFKMEPVKSSFIGYDIVMSIINQVYPKEDTIIPYNGIFNNVSFENIGPNSGYENKSVKLYRYKDYKIHQINNN